MQILYLKVILLIIIFSEMFSDLPPDFAPQAPHTLDEGFAAKAINLSYLKIVNYVVSNRYTDF